MREKLDLDQREAAEILGGGVNAFSKGKSNPPLALVTLLKISKVLDRHQQLLAEVRAT